VYDWLHLCADELNPVSSGCCAHHDHAARSEEGVSCRYRSCRTENQENQIRKTGRRNWPWGIQSVLSKLGFCFHREALIVGRASFSCFVSGPELKSGPDTKQTRESPPISSFIRALVPPSAAPPPLGGPESSSPPAPQSLIEMRFQPCWMDPPPAIRKAAT
jgi:hypothetical protein